MIRLELIKQLTLLLLSFLLALCLLISICYLDILGLFRELRILLLTEFLHHFLDIWVLQIWEILLDQIVSLCFTYGVILQSDSLIVIFAGLKIELEALL